MDNKISKILMLEIQNRGFSKSINFQVTLLGKDVGMRSNGELGDLFCS